MTRNFHRWEVDPFFNAAEEVQNSADRLESVYRTWVHVKSVADDASMVEFHRRELSTALGTAKWQLEDFERAVSCVVVDDKEQTVDDAPSRHRQFVDALHNQITTIQTTLFSSEDCKDLELYQALQLGEKEKDDLELFLCAKRAKEGCFCDSTKFKVGEELPLFSGEEPLQSKNEVSYHLSMPGVNSDIDSRKQCSDICLWSHEVGSFGKLLSDLHEIKVGKLCGRTFNEIDKPVSDPTPGHFQIDKGEIFGEQLNGHPRSVSVGSGLNAWKSGLLTVVRSKKWRLISVQIPSSSSSFWAMFAKACYLRTSRSDLKRWKDGDANTSDGEMLALLRGVHDSEQGHSTSWPGANRNCLTSIALDNLASDSMQHFKTRQQGVQRWQLLQYGLPSSRLVQIALAILVALGLVGLLSFHLSSPAS